MSIITSGVTQPEPLDPCQGFLTDLVVRCGQGDEAALGDLFDLTFFLVAALVKRDAVPSAVADDDVVEAFWRIWHRSADYEPQQQGVLSWVLDQARDDHARTWAISPAGRRA